MGRGPYWPDTRTPRLIAPTLDATSGRSYKQASQTPGALGGRRGSVRWFMPGELTTAPFTKNEMSPTVVGGWWRVVNVTAQLSSAFTGADLRINILADLPGAPAFVTIFLQGQFLTIPDGGIKANALSQNILKEAKRYVPYNLLHRIYPQGTTFIMNYSYDGAPSLLAEDLTLELHYIARAVGQ